MFTGVLDAEMPAEVGSSPRASLDDDPHTARSGVRQTSLKALRTGLNSLRVRHGNAGGQEGDSPGLSSPQAKDQAGRLLRSCLIETFGLTFMASFS